VLSLVSRKRRGQPGGAGRNPGRFAVGGVAVVFLLALYIAPAAAIQMSGIYDPNGLDAVDPCAQDPQNNFIYKACAGGVDRTPELHVLMQAAADYWEDVLEGPELIQVRYFYHLDPRPDANVLQTDVNGRPSVLRVRVPVDRTFYYDATPNDHSEYDMGPRLYRDTHPAEQGEAFSGAPPEVFEVSYKGKEVNSLSVDLYTIVLHELAHGLGLDKDVASTGSLPKCSAPPDNDYEVDPFAVGGVIMAIKSYVNPADPTEFDCEHLALGGIQACNNDEFCESHQALMWPGEFPDHRTLPGAADILAVADAAGWPYELPRKYSLFSDNWGLSFVWLGNAIPDANDEVFILNLPLTTITVLSPRVARNLTVSDGNRLNLFSTLDVGATILLADVGTVLTADIGSTVSATDLNIEGGALLDVPANGFVDSFRINNAESEIRGAGLVDVVSLTNTGKIRANGGPFTFTSSNFDPPFDLDGPNSAFVPPVEIQAVTGDLTFDGRITDSVRGTIRVAANRMLTFTQGWVQEAYAGGPLNLEGTAAEATVSGATTINGIVNADGLSRFTHDLTFALASSRLTITLGGTLPGLGHSQVNVNGTASLDGILDVKLQGGYIPAVGDEFIILTSPSVVGVFAQHQGLNLGIGGLSLDVLYSLTDVRLVVRGPVGGAPGSLTNPGTPMTVDLAPGGDLIINWGAPCTGERSFAVYEGTIGDFTSHVPLNCAVSGSSTVITPSLGLDNTYYLMVPTGDFREGSHGADSNGVERSVGAASCLLQAIATCGPQ
jgi:hypothetical protein